MSAVTTTSKGLVFARYCKSLLVAKGDALSAAGYAEGRGPLWADVALSLRSAVAPIQASNVDQIALATAIAFDFAEAMKPAALLGRMMPMVRRVPFDVRMISASSGLTAQWRGESLPISVGKVDFDTTEMLTSSSIGCIAVVTNELVRSSAPGVESILSADLVKAYGFAADQALLDPVGAGTASTPQSITFGATSFPSSGSSVAQIDADLRLALGVVTDADLDLSTAFWLMSPRTATYLATVRGSGGAAAYGGMSARGGSLLGIPALTSTAAPRDFDSPSENMIVLVVASELAVADDGAANVEVSQEAALQLDDAPASGAHTQVSLWQNGLSALKVVRYLNWKLRRPDAVACITGCNY